MYNPHPIDTCILILDCSYDPCINGDCVVLANGERRCNCWSDWTGQFCNSTVDGPVRRTDPKSAVSTAVIVIIIIAILVVLRKYCYNTRINHTVDDVY